MIRDGEKWGEEGREKIGEGEKRADEEYHYAGQRSSLLCSFCCLDTVPGEGCGEVFRNGRGGVRGGEREVIREG